MLFVRRIKAISIVVLVFSGVFTIRAQQLDQIGKKDAVKISGGFSANQNFYFSNDTVKRYNLYNYMLSANATVSLYGWSIPFNATYSNRELVYGQPFNIYGLSPTYKSLTIHLGYRSMTLSPLTLSGHSFLGAGVEWTWQKTGFGIAAMGGRLLKAVDYDTAHAYVIPAFERWGQGMKLTYGKKGTEIAVIAFHAKDVVGSIDSVPTHVFLTPQENMVYSISVKHTINELTVSVERAVSAWTRDLRDTTTLKDTKASNDLFLIPVNNSTLFYGALNAGVDLAFKKFGVGVAYERIDPDYHTLGAYFVPNDFENISLRSNVTLFKTKLTLSGSIGYQHDDLKKQKMTTTDRMIGNISAGFRPTKRLSLNLSFSSFNSYMKFKPMDDEYLKNTVYDQLDTMNYIQLSKTFSGSVNYIFLNNDNVTHSGGANSSWQDATSEQGNTRFGNSMLNNSLSYSILFKKRLLSVSLSVNNMNAYYNTGKSMYVGAGANSSITVLKKKMNISLGVNASNNYEDGTMMGILYSVNNNYSLKFGKHHVFGAGARFSGKKQQKASSLYASNKSFNEWMLTMSYAFRF